ncbi:Fic family protein [Mycobacterium tuberculosis]|uniref:Fic family protein n=1 Tax=Mycobacterium tuberculosis TaxID=1773 RepID=UPI00202A317A|nr:Fic family protein [Mycobacterium tuberculosis]
MHTDDWTGRQLGIVVHADLVRIHPFTDGNGRTTRLLADLVYATTGSSINCAYVELLRGYDRDRDIAALAAFIGVRPIET